MKPAESGRRPWWRWLSWALVLAGVAWMAAAVLREWPAVAAQLTRQSLAWIALSLALGALAVAHEGVAYSVLLRVYAAGRVNAAAAFRLFATAQMVRHVPGRFWGVVYQVGEVRAQLPPAATVRVNLDLTALVLGYGVLVPLSVLLWRQAGGAWGAAALASGVVALALLLRFDGISALLRLAERLPGRAGRAAREARPPAPYAGRTILLLSGIFLLHWLLYLLAWQAIGRSFGGLAGQDMLLLCAAYSLAWVVGFVSMVTPAGLGVREAAFVILASPLFPQADLAFLAAYLRIWLLAIDGLLFVTGLALRPRGGDVVTAVSSAPPPPESAAPSDPPRTPPPPPPDPPQTPPARV